MIDKEAIIIGGGFYGLRIAQFLKEDLKLKSVLVIEEESGVMQRASYNNQARVHNGYHYPRSVLTALRSRVNLPVFSKEYKDAIVDDFIKYYAVATQFSKVSAKQFHRFFERIEADITPDAEAHKLFDKNLIEAVYKVREYAFDSKKLKQIVLKELERLGVDVQTSEKALTVSSASDSLNLETDKKSYKAKYVINTTYSSINSINTNSKLPIIPLKHELTEMCLVDMPEILKDKAFTVMCGPFFSLMPFPPKNLYTLSHVRYTPHSEWHDSDHKVRNSRKYLKEIPKTSHYQKMYADVKRYMPIAKDIKYSGESLWEVKTVLPQSEDDDSRPILYKPHYGNLRNYICIMGGKIDNIYDTFVELRNTYER